MIVGIACGIRKRILIFNTSENLLHDPISVVDPKHFDWRIDIDDMTPVVVAYNNYHYESLEPVEEQDRQETIKLVNSYISGRYNTEYGFSRLDIKNLISPEDVIKSSIKETEHIQTDHIYTQTDQTNNEPKNQCRKNKLDRKPQSCQEMNYPSMKFNKEIKKNKQKTEQQEKDKNTKDSVLKSIPTKETETKSFHPDRFLFVKGKVKFE